MNRAVYIGGFGNGRGSAEKVGETLADLHGDVDVFTFSYARKNPEIVAKAVKRVPAYIHSAGFMTLRGMKPEYINAFSPPLPKKRIDYVVQTIQKSANMLSSKKRMDAPLAEVVKYDNSAIAELTMNPVANFRPLFNNEISEFDAIKFAVMARNVGIPVGLIYTDNDEYFKPSEKQLDEASNNGVPMFFVPGVHDQLVLTPTETIEAYHQQLR
jgi:hypothetical protein